MAGHRGPEHGQWHIELEAGADFIAFDIVMPATVAPMPRITGRIVRSETFPRILEHCFHLLSFFLKKKMASFILRSYDQHHMKEATMNGLTAISFSYVIARHSPNQPRLSNICSSILLGSTA